MQSGWREKERACKKAAAIRSKLHATAEVSGLNKHDKKSMDALEIFHRPAYYQMAKKEKRADE